MEEIINCKLFEGISENDVKSLLSELSAKERHFTKGETVIRPYESFGFTGIVKSGILKATRTDIDGNVTILSVLKSSDIFGQAISNSGNYTNVSVEASCESTVIFIDIRKLTSEKDYAIKFLHNLVKIMSEKIIEFNNRIDILSKKRTSEKIITYLNRFSVKNGEYFSVLLDRNDMADYLGVERSSLSRELSKMKEAGLIDYNKNRFCILSNSDKNKK